MLTKDQAGLLLRALNALWRDVAEGADEIDDLADVDGADLLDAMFALHKVAFGVDLREAPHDADLENKPEDAEQ